MVCQDEGVDSERMESGTRRAWVRLILPITGLLSLIWFLVRVIPKPSRATYPCQRVAFPLASGFVIWLTGLVGSVAFVRRARRHYTRARLAGVVLCVMGAAGILWLAMAETENRQAAAYPPVPNVPFGVAKGLNPGLFSILSTAIMLPPKTGMLSLLKQNTAVSIHLLSAEGVSLGFSFILKRVVIKALSF